MFDRRWSQLIGAWQEQDRASCDVNAVMGTRSIQQDCQLLPDYFQSRFSTHLNVYVSKIT
jgi:hypothetical protein